MEWLILAVMAPAVTVPLALAARIYSRKRHDRHYFIELPQRASQLHNQGKRAEAIRLMEDANQRRAYFGESVKVSLRLTLAQMCQSERRYTEAAQYARAALDSLSKSPKRNDAIAQATLTRCLAEALDAQGKTTEAEAVRSRMDALLQTGDRSAAWHELTARALAQKGRHSEAAEHWVSALAKLGRNAPVNSLALFTIQAGIAYFNAGRAEEGLGYLVQGGGMATDNVLRSAAYCQAALSAMTLNRLDEAETWENEALAAAHRLHQPDEISFSHAQFGHIQMLKGHLEAALDSLRQAENLSQKHNNLVRGLRFEICMLRGEFRDALAELTGKYADEKYPFASLQRRMDAVYALAAAENHVALNEPDDALKALDEAALELAKDEKHQYEVAAVRLLAEATRTPDSAALREAVRALQKQLAEVSERRDGDRTAQRPALGILARAAFTLGDDETALQLWAAYLEGRPRPVHLPNYWFYVGESRRRLGLAAEARAAYEQAVAPGIETLSARQARARLAEG